ncbi:MAG: polyprenyl synthetase family protein [Ruminococcaceae bacterium]|nr:polyprenyl synthetase family protein [Oscillospiraceae bacterium]
MRDIKTVINENAVLVENALKVFLDKKSDTTLYKAMEYSLMCGGKRIRPFLALEFCRMFGGSEDAVLPYAMAIEMIHTFSLIHDDLPCMDNDDLRRGKPTNHKVFGEATALLAGDAMVFSAFECALSNEHVSAENKLAAARELALSSGADGMCAGQMIDLEGEGKKLAFDELLSLHAHKTGCLIRAAAKLGAIAANADSDAIKAADTYGAGVGLAFQIIDDILDKFGSTEELGKPVGSDAKNEKTTFLTFMSAEEALEYAKKVTGEACAAICKYDNSELLIGFAEMLLKRKN